MTVFKTFLRILNKNKMIIMLYTGILLGFGALNSRTTSQDMNFSDTKPALAIINDDKDGELAKDLVRYLDEHGELTEYDLDLSDSDDSKVVDDALFYRQIHYLVYIPKDFTARFMVGDDVKLTTKSTGDFKAELSKMLVERYMKTANTYKNLDVTDAGELVEKIDKNIDITADATITSKLDTEALELAGVYFNFESYSILACLIYVICIVMSVFNTKKIKDRTNISSMDFKKHNTILLLCNCMYSVVAWAFYFAFGYVLFGKTIISTHGMLFALNSFLFTICAATIAFFIGSIVSNKDAIGGIVNVVSLGSSFLCGAFVPASWLPDGVLAIAHALPTYYYINANDRIKQMETFDMTSLKPVLIDMGIVMAFALAFVIMTNVVSAKKRRV